MRPNRTTLEQRSKQLTVRPNRSSLVTMVNNWRESVWEDLLDDIAEDISQLDSDEFTAV